MPVRSTMSSLIARVRLLINDPSGASQHFQDQDIQDVLDEGRQDYRNEALTPSPTFVTGSIQYLDYYHSENGWEDGTVFKQYLTVVVTPSLNEPIQGHWQFATSTLPPIYITGSLHDVYRAAADLLERWAAVWVLRYSISVDGQNLQRGQVTTALQNLAHTYRRQQRPRTMAVPRTDLVGVNASADFSLAPKEIDYMSSGNGS